MNTSHYKDIFKEFEEYHHYMAKDVSDYRPKGDLGIRLTMKDGSMYDYDTISKGVRQAKIDYRLNKDEITDIQCRKSFAYHLTEMMTIRGYNQQSLSEYTGISKASIHSYLKADKTPSITNLRKIAYALNCSIAELID